MTKLKPKDYGHEYDVQNPLDNLAMELERKLSDTITDRNAIDIRMVEDLQNYHGSYDQSRVAELKKAKRSSTFIKLTRAKTNAGESQLIDLLFPNTDKNWGIKPTPVPEIADQLNDDSPAQIDGQKYQDEEGEIVTNGMLAARKLQIANDRCDKMEDEINDQLVESDYEAKCRKVIHDACVIGTGILKGPVVVGKQDKVYMETKEGWTHKLVESLTPACEVVRPWDFFPDMSASHISECEFVFERRFMSKAQLKGLVKRKGFDKEQIKKVLQMTGAQTQHSSSYMDDVRRLAGLSESLNDTRFETWEYTGPVSYDALIRLGAVELPEDAEERDALLKEFEGEEVIATVFYCGGITIGAKLKMMDYEDYLPYRVFNWEPDDSCLFGYGVPRMVRDEQAIINSVWRMILDNGAITAGPQIGRSGKHISPVNGDWALEPFKQWELSGSVDDIRKVFTAMEFNSHLPELQGIYQMARIMFDEVSGIPMLQQGEQGQSTQTLGGMSILMNSANTVRRRQVKAWDDNITSPMIKDFYHWNMEYNENGDIKGDYQVDARGTSALLVKETQAAAITNFLGVVGSNPVFAPVLQLKAAEILRQWAKTQSLPASMLPTDEELEEFIKKQQEQQGEQPQDSAIAVEQMRMDQQQAKFKFEYEMFGAKVQAGLQEAASKERIEMMRLAQNDKINTEKLIADLKKNQAKLDSDWQQFMAELNIKYKFESPTANYGLGE
ncbi:MAG: hypothetical protein GW836_00655 [Paraglaciecola sp.]|nr:hypothetical protein [Paraglaciecola sp.]